MTRIFTDDGDSVPVTVLDVSDNRITQVKTPERRLLPRCRSPSASVVRAASTSRPQGHFAKAGAEAGMLLQGIPLDGAELAGLPAGRRGLGGDLQGRAEGRRHRHLEGQGLRGRHQAPQLQLQPGESRQLACRTTSPARSARPGPGARVSGQAHGRPAWATCSARSPDLEVDPRRCRARQLLLVRGAIPGAAGGSVIVRPRGAAKGVRDGSQAHRRCNGQATASSPPRTRPSAASTTKRWSIRS